MDFAEIVVVVFGFSSAISGDCAVTWTTWEERAG
jgi:hypothetical protein